MMKLHQMVHPAKRVLALLVAVVMTFGTIATVSGAQAETAETEVMQAVQEAASEPVRGSNYRNLTLNPGAVVNEMRFTWHSGSPTGSIRITNPQDTAWYAELPAVSRPAVAHGGIGAMGVTTNLLPTRPGYTYYVHQVSVYNLAPDTVYNYVVMWDNGQSAPKTFRTGGSNTFQFLVAGDPQIGVGDGLNPTSATAEATVDGVNWLSTLDVATAAYPNTDFILAVGDQIQTANGTNADTRHIAVSQYRHDRMFSPAPLHSLPLLAVVGNHDGWTFNDDNANIRLWPLHYNIPAPDTTGTVGGINQNVFRHRGEMYTQFDYWVRWGNVLFLVLDSNGANDGVHRVMSGARLAFLEGAVEQNDDADWVVATFHHPMFCVYRLTNIQEKTQLINNWLPHLERLGVDVILNGHSHAYSRTHHMRGTVPQLYQQWLDASGSIVAGTQPTNAVLDPDGIAHIVFNSASGSGFYNVASMPRSYISVYNQNFRRNFSVVDVTPYTFSVRTYQINNDNSHTLVDVYTIVQSDAYGGVPAAVESLPQMGEQIFERITQPGPITVPHGTEMTVEALGLPETVGIETNLFNNVGGNTANVRPPNAATAPYSPYGTNVRTPRAPVIWDLAGLDFDPDNRLSQTFYITGTIESLPDGIANPLDIPFYVTVRVTVLRYGGVQPGPIAQWMQADGMEAYFLAAGGFAARVPRVLPTYGEPNVLEPLRFFVGENYRLFHWNAGAPTILNEAATGPGGLNNLTEPARWTTTVSTAGRAGIEVEFAIRSDPAGTGANNNGPRDWQLQYSTDGVNWLNAGAPIVMSGFWDNGVTRQLSAHANDREVLHIRWLMTSDIAVGGGAISPTARHHMRNINVRSTIPLIPNCECGPYADCCDGNCLICQCCKCDPTDDCCDLDCNPCLCNQPLRIDVLMFNDFHGHIEAGEPVPENPGAARLTAYIQYKRSQNPNPNNVVVVGGGDDFHGYAVSTLTGGEPVLTMLGYLAYHSPAQQDSGIHVAFGNHEFSFGYARAVEFGYRSEVTLLAADLFYTGEHPNAGTQPAFVRPYDILEFPDHDITVAIVGLMTNNMPALVGGWTTLNLHGRTPAPGAPQEYTDAIAELIYYLRNERGAAAVVGVTHMGANHPSMTYVAQNLDFDALVGGHAHARVIREVNGIPIIEAAHSGRAIGRFSLIFCDEGELETVEPWLSPVGAIAAFDRSAAIAAGVVEHYDAVAALMLPYIEETYEVLRGPRGPYGIYFADRAGRDVWVSRLVLDYVVRWAEVNNEPTDWIGISNSGGWRNTGFWPRNADDQTNMAELISTMPFDNNILLFEMHGVDLLALINVTGLTGTQVRSGVHQVGSNWYVTATGERITNDRSRTYNVIGSNFIFGGLGQTGGDNYPWPGNIRGNQMGMYDLSGGVGPRVVMQEGAPAITWTDLLAMSTASYDWEALGVSMIRTALLDSTDFRSVTPNAEWQAELTVAATNGGTAVIVSPFAPGDRSRNVNIIPQWVTVSANPASGYEFIGWWNAGDDTDTEPLSINPVFSFAIRENTNLEARFIDGGQPIEYMTVREARETALGEVVTVRGIATAFYETNANFNNSFFLQCPTGTCELSGIHVRLVDGNQNLGAAAPDGARAFIGHLVEVTGVRQLPTATNGFQGIDNIMTAGHGVRIIEENVDLPAPVPVALLTDLIVPAGQSRPFSSMLVSVTEPVQIYSLATTGPGNTPLRAEGWPTAGTGALN
ncbi:MAG: metallophosphoesterase, partial [Firmicutes bacterium]|nr:metallophosphoesterase [Bacillota bacterium]